MVTIHTSISSSISFFVTQISRFVIAGTFLISQFGLTCDKNYQVELSTTIYMIGSALGAALISPLSDRYGRKVVMLICLWIQGVLGVAVAFVNSYVLFVILRFFIAFLNMVSSV